MSLRKGLLFFFIFMSSLSYSQTDLSFKLGVSPWHFADQFDDLSNPISLGYSGGINVERILSKNSVGIMTGIEYMYAKPGTKYTDLSDQENFLAVVYEREVNQHFVGVTHHEFTVPLQFIFYHNGLRTGIGASYSRYFFENSSGLTKYRVFNDYGLNVFTGARLSNRLIFSIGYYYGLKNIIQLNALPSDYVEEKALNAKMQQIRINLSISLFNTIKESQYFITYSKP